MRATAMTDEQAETVRNAVAEFLCRDWSPGTTGNPADFERLVTYVELRLTQDGAGPDPFDVAIVTAMCLMGPESFREVNIEPAEPRSKREKGRTLRSLFGARSIPPENMRNEMHDILTNALAEIPLATRRQHITEYVAAYGCGKWRGEPQPIDHWQGMWAGARQMIAVWIRPYKQECDTFLAQDVNFARDLRSNQAYLLHETERMILAIHYVHPPRTETLTAQDTPRVQFDPSAALLVRGPGPGTLMAEVTEGDQFVFTTDAPLALSVVDAEKPGQLLRTMDVLAGDRLVLTRKEMYAQLSVRRVEEARGEPRVKTYAHKASGVQEIRLTGRATLTVPHCTCGHYQCDQDHRLKGWNPLARVRIAGGGIDFMSLNDHLASAIKGVGAEGRGAHVVSGGFSVSMYFAFRRSNPFVRGYFRYLPKRHRKQFVLVGLDKPTQRVQDECVCVECKNHFGVPCEEDIEAANCCVFTAAQVAGGNPFASEQRGQCLFTQDELNALWQKKKANTPLLKARALEEEAFRRHDEQGPRGDDMQVWPWVWCPVCDDEDRLVRTLPQKTAKVWSW